MNGKKHHRLITSRLPKELCHDISFSLYCCRCCNLICWCDYFVLISSFLLNFLKCRWLYIQLKKIRQKNKDSCCQQPEQKAKKNPNNCLPKKTIFWPTWVFDIKLKLPFFALLYRFCCCRRSSPYSLSSPSFWWNSDILLYTFMYRVYGSLCALDCVRSKDTYCMLYWRKTVQ